MEELHAAIAAYLRAQHRHLAEAGDRESAVLLIWQDRYAIPQCKVCGVAIDSDEGVLDNLANMLAVRECRDHYVPF